ncbi:MAG: glycerophosphodiester phosphodiesterase family protein [bacterium]
MKLFTSSLLAFALSAFACATVFAVDLQPPQGSVRVIAHRGASGYAPENTMAAFKKAVEMGPDMIEFDVHRTIDGKIVVMHDDATLRTTGVKNSLATMTYDEVSKLDAGSSFSKDFAGEKVPTLSEVLEFAKGKVQVNIEIKAPGCEEETVRLINKLGLKETAIVSSFDHNIIKKIKELDPEIKTGALVGDIGSAKNIDSIIENCHPDAINPRYLNVSKSQVKAAHEKGLAVNVYTVNDAVTMQRLIKAGVDGIFSNYPDMLKEVVGKMKKPAAKTAE